MRSSPVVNRFNPSRGSLAGVFAGLALQIATAGAQEAPNATQPAQKPTTTAPETPAPAQPAPIVGKLQPVRGVVFDDADGSGKREDGEAGIAGVRVSNGRDVTRTDDQGRYELTIDDDDIVFVIKPRNWMTPVDEHQLPRFYYIHKPGGSPPSLKFAGVAPTGPLPASVDFPLRRKPEPDTFKALIFGDTQPRDIDEVEYIARDVVVPLIEENKAIGATMGVTLGDVVFDDLRVFPPLNKAVSLLGIPWYNVMGNHDTNHDSADDVHSGETWQRVFGPQYYSFDHGPTHFLVLDDIRWLVQKDGKHGYVGGLGPDQMQFIRNDLASIPADQLVVLMMHIPLVDVEDRKELYDLIAKRPYSISIAAHTHYQQHIFIDDSDGFHGPKPHHHIVNVTVCGSWWRGARDERGIPHTTMRDGAPNGYSIFTFDGHDYGIEYRAASRPADYQMNIYAPDAIAVSKAAETEVLANVFAGSTRSKVELRLGDSGNWIPMKQVDVEDPEYVATKAREDALLAAVSAQDHGEKKSTKRPFISLPETIKSPHIWSARLPANPSKGSHLIHVRETDMFGKTHTDARWIRID